MTSIATEQAFRARNLPIPRIRVTTFSLQLRMHLLAAGDFLTAMPRSLPWLSAGGIRLKALPVKLPIQSFPVAVVTLKNRTLTPVVELFLKRLRKSARDNGLNINRFGGLGAPEDWLAPRLDRPFPQRLKLADCVAKSILGGVRVSSRRN